MNCPTCSRSLIQMKVGQVSLDACHGGCGGIWFDSHELETINEEKSTGEIAADIVRHPDSKVDETRVRSCPRCDGVAMERRLFSLGTGVEMDCCPRCRGIWLDHGELEKIHEETNLLFRKPATPAPQPVRRIPVNFALIREVQRLRVADGARL